MSKPLKPLEEASREELLLHLYSARAQTKRLKEGEEYWRDRFHNASRELEELKEQIRGSIDTEITWEDFFEKVKGYFDER